MEPTKEQQKVIDFKKGRAVVGACAGSGKTATLVTRTKELPQNETKLIMAFNKKAATEFQDRLVKAPLSTVRTIHSFCMRAILENHIGFGFKSRPSVSTDNQFRKICIANDAPREWLTWDQADDYWDRQYFEYAERNFFTSEVLERILFFKDKINLSENDQLENRTLKAVWRYRKFLMDCNLMTFDSMVRVVAENKDKLKKAADHIMIDEYQDVDRFQFEIIYELTAMAGVISSVVVGDHNQRIYEWRGALEDAFKQFKTSFPDAKEFFLTKNFRSYENILEFANEFCEPKMVGSKGYKENSVVFGDLEDLIKDLKSDYSSATILCRYNRDCALWKLRLVRQGLPVFVLGGADFWALPHIKVAKKIWKAKIKYEAALETAEWKKLESRKFYAENEKALEEIRADLKWLLDLTQSDLRILEDNLQNEREGIKISTIHKTKGLEFPRVMIYGVSDELKRETCLFYVASTRPKELLVLS